MKRRNFLKTTAAGSAFFATNNLFLFEKDKDFNVKAEDLIDPIVVFKFFPDLYDAQLSQMIEMKSEYGLRRYAFRFPDKGIRISRVPENQDYKDLGELLLRVKKDLAPHDIEVNWKCNATFRSGKESPWQDIIGIDGRTSRIDVTCPLDPEFRETFIDNFATIVKIARPAMIVIEDDFHLNPGCFCPLHLKEFEKKQNQYYSRQELSDIFNQETRESMKLRHDWADLSRETLVKFATSVREKVDEIAPETRILLNQPGSSDFHGDFTEAVTKAFAGKTRPAVRLFGTSYGSDAAPPIPTILFNCLYKSQRLPSDFELYHESCNFPNTRFYMSAAKLRSLMTVIFGYGLDNSMFWPVTMLDNPLKDDGYASMFKKEYKRFNSIKSAVRTCKVEGCEILYNPSERILRNSTRGYSWANVTGRMGIPHTSIDGNVKLVSDNHINTMSDEEIKNLLKGNIFLDGRAAFQLYKRGYGNMIGAEVQPGDEINFIYEFLRDIEGYESINGRFMTNYLQYGRVGPEGGAFYLLNPSDDAEIITDFLDPDKNPVTPGIIRYKNELGGRVAITAFDFAANNENSAILNFRKKEIYRITIEWLGNKPLPVFVKQAPNVFCTFSRSISGNYAVVILVNLSSDPLESISLDVAPEWLDSKFELLNNNGEWHAIDAEVKNRTLKVNTNVILMDPVVLKFNKRYS